MSHSKQYIEDTYIAQCRKNGFTTLVDFVMQTDVTVEDLRENYDIENGVNAFYIMCKMCIDRW